MGGHLKTVAEEEFKNATKTGIVLVDFYADWCGPCRMMTPVLEEVAKKNPEIAIIKVDVDQAQQVASQYQVTSIPTLVLLKDGKEVGRLVGLRDAEAIQEFIATGS